MTAINMCSNFGGFRLSPALSTVTAIFISNIKISCRESMKLWLRLWLPTPLPQKVTSYALKEAAAHLWLTLITKHQQGMVCVDV